MVAKKQGLEGWRKDALGLPKGDYKLRLPVHVQTGEAVDLSTFVKARWASKMNGAVIEVPGLETTKGKLKQSVSDELLSLEEALQQAQTAYLKTSRGGGEAGLDERGKFLEGEIEAALEWLFDDGVEDERDAQLAAVKSEHTADPETHDALASALEDYAGLAGDYRDELEGAGGFEGKLIDEAKEVAAKLHALPSANAVTRNDAAADALELRNRVGFLLQQKMNEVRRHARYVFRNHPAIAKEATSAYERRKRAEGRRAQKKTVPATPPPATTPKPA